MYSFTTYFSIQFNIKMVIPAGNWKYCRLLSVWYTGVRNARSMRVFHSIPVLFTSTIEYATYITFPCNVCKGYKHSFRRRHGFNYNEEICMKVVLTVLSFCYQTYYLQGWGGWLPKLTLDCRSGVSSLNGRVLLVLAETKLFVTFV